MTRLFPSILIALDICAALVWWWFKAQNRPVLSPRSIMKHAVEELVPAPTAQEILEAMNGSKAFETGVQMRDGGCFCYRCRISANSEEEFSTAGERLPDALMRLWMDICRESTDQ